MEKGWGDRTYHAGQMATWRDPQLQAGQRFKPEQPVSDLNQLRPRHSEKSTFVSADVKCRFLLHHATTPFYPTSHRTLDQDRYQSSGSPQLISSCSVLYHTQVICINDFTATSPGTDGFDSSSTGAHLADSSSTGAHLAAAAQRCAAANSSTGQTNVKSRHLFW